jgi:uncharacterized protein (DUF1330 family)
MSDMHRLFDLWTNSGVDKDYIMIQPIYIVASLWIREEALEAFEAYERKASQIMRRYGGSIERTMRPATASDGAERPFEIHLLRFPSDELFERYRADSELKALSVEREAVITRTLLLTGSEGPAYDI